MKLKMALLSTALLATSAMAGNIYTTAGVSIEQIEAYSPEETIFPNWRNMIQVKTVEAMPWNAAGCDPHYVAIRGVDQHLVDFALSAKLHNKKIIVGSDTNLPKLNNAICIARVVTVK